MTSIRTKSKCVHAKMKSIEVAFVTLLSCYNQSCAIFYVFPKISNMKSEVIVSTENVKT